MLIASLESRQEKKCIPLIGKRKEDVIMKASYEYDKLDKREDYVNVGIYDVYAIDEDGFTTAHWTIRAGSKKSAIKYVEEHPDDYEVKWEEYLVAEPRYFPEVAYTMPFEF